MAPCREVTAAQLVLPTSTMCEKTSLRLSRKCFLFCALHSCLKPCMNVPPLVKMRVAFFVAGVWSDVHKKCKFASDISFYP